MTLNELITAIQARSTTYHDAGMSKVQIDACLRSLGDVAAAELLEFGEVPLPGLGKLVADRVAGRTGRNPATGETIDIPPKTVAKFRASKALKEAIA